MKIEVWSDFVCPFCYLGERHLEQALAQFPDKDTVEIEFRSFELEPNQPLYSGMKMHELLAKKYGMSIEDAKAANERVGKEAAKVGLEYHFDEMKYTNTFDAHRLAKYAKTVGKEKQIIDKIFSAYFTESKLISDQDTLVQIAESEGLDKDTVLKVLNDKTKYANDVRNDEEFARKLGVQGVPFFLINQKHVISGAHPIEVFVDTIKTAWKEETALK